MDSQEYIQLSRFDQNVVARPAQSERWGFAAEKIILAAMTKDVTTLERLAGEHDSFMQEGSEKPFSERATLPPIGKDITEALTAMPEQGTRPVYELMDETKKLMASLQAVDMSRFFRNRVAHSRGENAASLNHRMIKGSIAPAIRPIAIEMARTNSDTHGGMFEFSVNGTPLPEWQFKRYYNKTLAILHSTLFEYDVLIAAAFMINENQLPYVPIIAGPAAEQYAFDIANMNADILLVQEDGLQTIPVQTKINAWRDLRSHYHDAMVNIDAKTLGLWEMSQKTVRTERKNTITVPKVHFIAGRLASKLAAIRPNKKLPKSLKELGGPEEATSRLARVIEQNPYHSLAA